MSFKIQNRILSITNYPSVERHLEDMANHGWLLTHIILESIFIYKKIEAESLDFSITPYEIEKSFTRKSKEELEEFRTVCKSIGWNYATKSKDFHIYFKEKTVEAVDLETDEEEELNTLEEIDKKQRRASFFIIPVFLLMLWFIFTSGFDSIEFMKMGLLQGIVVIGSLLILMTVGQLLRNYKFFKDNRENLELGKPIEYNNSKFYFERIINCATLIFFIFFLVSIIYESILSQNISPLVALLPIVVIRIILGLYNIFIKPAKKSFDYKVFSLILTIILAFVISSSITLFNQDKIGKIDKENISGLKVLSPEDFNDEAKEGRGELRIGFSILIPNSYEYIDSGKTNGYMETDYTNSLTESIAKRLVKKYIKRAEKVQDKSIAKDTEKLWNLDEAYFLTYKKDEIVIRRGKEVFYLSGMDFSDPEVIKLAKEKLGL